MWLHSDRGHSRTRRYLAKNRITFINFIRFCEIFNYEYLMQCRLFCTKSLSVLCLTKSTELHTVLVAVQLMVGSFSHYSNFFLSSAEGLAIPFVVWLFEFVPLLVAGFSGCCWSSRLRLPPSHSTSEKSTMMMRQKRMMFITI